MNRNIPHLAALVLLLVSGFALRMGRGDVVVEILACITVLYALRYADVWLAPAGIRRAALRSWLVSRRNTPWAKRPFFLDGIAEEVLYAEHHVAMVAQERRRMEAIAARKASRHEELQEWIREIRELAGSAHQVENREPRGARILTKIGKLIDEAGRHGPDHGRILKLLNIIRDNMKYEPSCAKAADGFIRDYRDFSL